MSLQAFISKQLPAISAAWLNFVDLFANSRLTGVDSGVVNAYVVALPSGAGQSFNLAVGALVRFTTTNTNTGAATLNVAGTGVANIVGQSGLATVGGEITSTGVNTVRWTGTAWQTTSSGASPDRTKTPLETSAAQTPLNYSRMALPIMDISRYVSDNTGTDVTAQLIAAFASQKNIIVPEGTYGYSSNFVPPTFVNVEGTPGKSILKPTAAVTIGLTIPTSSHWRGIKLDGSSTSGAIGLKVGGSLTDQVDIEYFEISNFTGANALGMLLQDCVSFNGKRVIIQDNTSALKVSGVTPGSLPTTTTFSSSKFRTSTGTGTTGYGVLLESGQLVSFVDGCIFEQNQLAGFWILPTTAGSRVYQVIVDKGWFESNYKSDITKYHVIAGDGTALGGAVIEVVLRDCFFNVVNGVTCKSVDFNGSAVQGGLISNPRWPSSVGAATINIRNSAIASIQEWPSERVYTSLVSDSTNTTVAPSGVFTYTPTRNGFTEVLGGGAITAAGRATIIGNRCEFAVTITCTGGATIASTANTSFLSGGLPTTTKVGMCEAVRYDNTTSLGNGSTGGAGIVNTPTWGAAANATYVITGFYELG